MALQKWMQPQLVYVLVGTEATARTDIDWAVSLQLKRSEAHFF